MTDIFYFILFIFFLFFFFLVKRAGRHFGFFKRAGRHEKGAGRRALQKKPRQNTANGSTGIIINIDTISNINLKAGMCHMEVDWFITYRI